MANSHIWETVKSRAALSGTTEESASPPVWFDEIPLQIAFPSRNAPVTVSWLPLTTASAIWFAEYALALKIGVPLSRNTVEELRELAAELGLEFPNPIEVTA